MNSAIAINATRPLAPADLAPTAAAHAQEIRAWIDNRSYGRPPLPAPVCARVREEIAQVTTGSSRPEWAAAKAVQLVAAWPQAMHDEGQAKAYLRMVAEVLAEFPPHIAAAAAGKLIRQQKFRPAVSEVLEACEDERAGWVTLRIGLDRMDAVRSAREADESAARGRAEKERAQAVAADAAAVQRFGENGVRSGDYSGAMRTFQLLNPLRRGASPWMIWTRLVWVDREWPSWLALSMRRAGIFGRAQLGMARGQATLEDVAAVQRQLVAGDEVGARELVDAIERRPLDEVKAAKVDLWRVGEVPKALAELAEPFRELLTEPAAPSEEAAP